MTRFLPYIVKTLWRHRSRILLTLAGSAVALFVFCFVGAGIQQGGFSLHSHFNHNDLFHVVQMGAFYLLFRGASTVESR